MVRMAYTPRPRDRRVFFFSLPFHRLVTRYSRLSFSRYDDTMQYCAAERWRRRFFRARDASALVGEASASARGGNCWKLPPRRSLCLKRFHVPDFARRCIDFRSARRANVNIVEGKRSRSRREERVNEVAEDGREFRRKFDSTI